ncbi:BOS complex subunit NOMO3-like [Lineus longissimus]|uniref:BOS complex subunit NOMO3-like n=1 Tax=Lineus longissimus TaxID=88925 RepID=UPI002B4E932E
MTRYLLFFTCSIVNLFHLIYPVASQDILGCGGFVKSDVEINYSLVEVKLYTKQGSLKYQMDCAPNNGYYMIPVYDKGVYVLKVEPPKGWEFEPESIELNIDGSTDKCSKGEDINFQFVGFAVEGKVLSKGQDRGPEGVTVSLKKKDGMPLNTLQTKTDGRFFFKKVLPGEYEVEASHSHWLFEKSKVSVKVDVTNAKVPASLVVHGYDVNGQVLSDGEPVRGVNFLLFSSTVKAQDIKGCDTTPVKSFKARGGKQPLCHVVSNQDGSFSISSVPTGEYSLIPFYKGEQITFDVLPAKKEFKVEYGSVAFQEPFQVAGFSVSGRVLNAKEGSGVANAVVFVDEKEVTKTKADGTYHLVNMKTGTYSLKITAENIGFDDLTAKISPNTPQLQDITPSSFRMCGNIVIDKIPRGFDISTKDRKVELLTMKNAVLGTLVADESGKFCTYVRPGSFRLKPVIGDEEATAGLKLSPEVKEVVVTDKPLSGIMFSQFKAKASGSVSCLSKCGVGIQITLVAAGKSGDHRTYKVESSGNLAVFSFDDLMPGRYQVTLAEDQWCWKEKSMKFEVIDKDVTNLDFVQNGFLFTYTSTHDMAVNYHVEDGKMKQSGSVTISKGTGIQCLATAGIYKLEPVSCHQFEKDSYSFDINNPSVVTFTAIKHQIEGTITSQHLSRDIMVTLSSSLSSDKSDTYGPLKAEGVTEHKDKKKPAPKGPFTYKFKHWARSGERLTVMPSSKELLFYPSLREILVEGDTCPGDVVDFEGRMGVFISGKISPPLSNVEVTITAEGAVDNVIVASTDNKGSYNVGPLHDNTEYVVKAAMAGYVMTPVDGKQGHFKAFKLGQISVDVMDEDKKALGSVLLSLSGGGQYRSNNLTHDNGNMIFTNLSPGQYFLRPMMKEYQFDPSSKMIEVTEGSTVSLKVKGKRIAYSCYGSVTSLNGEPEAGVVIEAAGKGDNCATYQEETKTEKDGTYRIRGLQPNCEYEVRLKSGEVNEHIERSAPKSRMVKVSQGDLGDVNIIAFRRMNQMDLSGRISTPTNFLSSLKVILFREDQPDSPISTVKIGASNFFYLPSVLIDNKNYVVRLESSLSKYSYDYELPETTFTANSSYKHCVMVFDPKMKSTEQELNHGSFLIVPLAALVVLFSYHFQKIKPYLAQATGRLSSNAAKKNSNQTSSQPAPSYDPSLLETDVPSAKKKVRVRRT